jgi:hypothetical protein
VRIVVLQAERNYICLCNYLICILERMSGSPIMYITLVASLTSADPHHWELLQGNLLGLWYIVFSIYGNENTILPICWLLTAVVCLMILEFTKIMCVCFATFISENIFEFWDLRRCSCVANADTFCRRCWATFCLHINDNDTIMSSWS